MSNDDINNNLITNNKREIKKSDTNENKIKHYKYCSNLNINNGINNDFSETNNNTNKDKEKNNNQSKTKEQNKNVNNNNNINKNKTNESGKNIILLNNDIKSCSLKVLPIKQLNQNDNYINDLLKQISDLKNALQDKENKNRNLNNELNNIQKEIEK